MSEVKWCMGKAGARRGEERGVGLGRSNGTPLSWDLGGTRSQVDVSISCNSTDQRYLQ